MSCSRIDTRPPTPNTYSLGKDLAQTARRALIVTAVIFAAFGLIAILAHAGHSTPLIKLIQPLNLKNSIALTLICAGTALLLTLPELPRRKTQKKEPRETTDQRYERENENLKKLYPIIHKDSFKTIYSTTSVAQQAMQTEKTSETQIKELLETTDQRSEGENKDLRNPSPIIHQDSSKTIYPTTSVAQETMQTEKTSETQIKEPRKTTDEMYDSEIKQLQQLYPILYQDSYKTIYSAKSVAQETVQKKRTKKIQIKNGINIATTSTAFVDINRLGTLAIQGHEILKNNRKVPKEDNEKRSYIAQKIYDALGSQTLTEVVLSLFDQQGEHPLIMRVFGDMIENGKNPEKTETVLYITHTKTTVTFTVEYIFLIWEMDPIKDKTTIGYNKIRITYDGKKGDFEAQKMDQVTCEASVSTTFTDLESARNADLERPKKSNTTTSEPSE